MKKIRCSACKKKIKDSGKHRGKTIIGNNTYNICKKCASQVNILLITNEIISQKNLEVEKKQVELINKIIEVLQKLWEAIKFVDSKIK